MSDDLQERISALRSSGGGYDLLKAEIAGETASSLGHHGRQVEAAMTAIRAFDAEAKGTAEERVALLRTAARAVSIRRGFGTPWASRCTR